MARPRSGKVPRNAIKHLTDRHRAMARSLVLGERQCDVAKAFGISQTRLSDIARSPVFIGFMQALSREREVETLDILEEVRKGACKGLDILLRTLEEGTDEYKEASIRTKVQVIRDLLDREGSLPRLTRTQASRQTTNLHLTSEDIEEIKRGVRGGGPANELCPVTSAPSPSPKQ